VDFDPTNDVIPGLEHVTCAWGRDYGDVGPVAGVVLGGGGHVIAVAVDVNPVAEAPPRR
jgi:transglutaminase-like putative cysteine protease